MKPIHHTQILQQIQTETAGTLDVLHRELPTLLSVGSHEEYLVKIHQIPRLSAEQELALANMKHDNDEAAHLLMIHNLRFVAHIAKGFLGYGLPLADIIQEGNVGLLTAVKRFDPNIGVRLVTYAVHWIRAEIYDYVVTNWRMVKTVTSKAHRKLFFNLRKSTQHVGWLSANDAQSIANELSVDLHHVYEMEKRLAGQDLSLDLSDDDDDQNIPMHLTDSDNDPAMLSEQQDLQQHNTEALNSALKQLDSRSRDILHRRWLTEHKSTLHDLAAQYNVSAERIRQLEKHAFAKINTLILDRQT